MKFATTLLLLLFFGFVSFAQNISLEETVKKDDFTKAVTIVVTPKEEVAQRRNVVKTFLTIEEGKRTFPQLKYIKSEKGEEFYLLNFVKAIDLGCLSSYDGKAMILFEDGETLTLKQQSETDCGDTINVNYYLASAETIKGNDMTLFQAEQQEYISLMITKKITKIRIYGSKYYDEIALRPETQDIFQKMFLRIDNLIE